MAGPGIAGRARVRAHDGGPADAPSASAGPPAFGGVTQNVSFQLFRVPVSWAAVSWTRSFQVPLAVSLEAFTV